MIKTLLLHSLVFFLLSAPAQAETTLDFIGQFGDKAVIHINGKQRVIKVGETSRDGIKLLSVEADSAVIRYQGKQQTLNFSPHARKTTTKKHRAEVRIWADRSGSFLTPGTINGQLVNFLIDTGATHVALNEVVARKLGIDFRYSGTPTTVTTASGMVAAYDLTLGSVKVGEIELNNVQATVLEGGFPLEVLLGMSFLSHLELERKGNMIKLKKTH